MSFLCVYVSPQIRDSASQVSLPRQPGRTFSFCFSHLLSPQPWALSTSRSVSHSLSLHLGLSLALSLSLSLHLGLSRSPSVSFEKVWSGPMAKRCLSSNRH